MILNKIDGINIVKINSPTIYCVGDLHGNFNSINGLIKMYNLRDCIIIFCGDIGFGFHKFEYYNQTFNKLNKLCKTNNVNLIFIRGNHDDPSYFDCDKIYKSHIMAVSDYTVLKNYPLEDFGCKTSPYNTILCIGGATSIDRISRHQDWEMNVVTYMRYHNCSLEEAEKNTPIYYWEDEQPIYDEIKLNKLKELNINIETICAHTSPSFCEPLTKDGISLWTKYDEKLSEDIDKERHTMDMIYNHLKRDNHILSHFIYGHYHFHHTDRLNGTSFVLLDMVRNSKFDTFTLSNGFNKTLITN